jgi:glycosyltransferase involved in cell wall biosynthesis
VELVDFPEWGPAKLPHHLRDPWFESLTAPSKGSIVLHFCLPDQVAVDEARLNVNFTMFEATRIPADWVRRHEQHDLVILPTESSRRAWVESGVPESKLRLCPLGVGDEYLREAIPPLPLGTARRRRVGDYAVRFLNVSELGPRKNLDGLVGAWLRATTAGDDAVLILKLGSYTAGSLAVFEQRIAQVQKSSGRSLAEAAPVHFIYDILPDADMPRLLAAATHYISLSFGEGWDQSMMEAGATGLRLIAPDHSAYPTYLDDAVASMVPSRRVPAIFPGGGRTGNYFEGADWWQPDEDEAVSLIRRAIDRQDGQKTARERIRGRFTWAAAAGRLIDILDELEATARPAAP